MTEDLMIEFHCAECDETMLAPEGSKDPVCEKCSTVMGTPCRTPLTPEIMKALGFTTNTPFGNNRETWWSNDLFDLHFTKLPTTAELFCEINSKGAAHGVEFVRTEIKKALGL